MKTFLFSYTYQGEEYSFPMPAETSAEAQHRAIAIRNSLRYDGELMGEMSADLPGSGLIVRLLVWLGNLFRRD